MVAMRLVFQIWSMCPAWFISAVYRRKQPLDKTGSNYPIGLVSEPWWNIGVYLNRRIDRGHARGVFLLHVSSATCYWLLIDLHLCWLGKVQRFPEAVTVGCDYWL